MMRIGRAKIAACARHILEFFDYTRMDSSEEMFNTLISADVRSNGSSGIITLVGEKNRADVFYRMRRSPTPLRLTIARDKEGSYDSRVVIHTYNPYSTYDIQDSGLFGNFIATKEVLGGMSAIRGELQSLANCLDPSV